MTEANERQQNRAAKTAPLNTIDMSRERLPKNVKEMIRLNNLMQQVAEGMYMLTQRMMEHARNNF